MALEITKTTRLVGNLKIGDEVVKQYTVDVDEHGVSLSFRALCGASSRNEKPRKIVPR